jgi:hypothetical protein
MPFLNSYAKTCMDVGIVLNKILLIELSYFYFYFLSVLTKNILKHCKQIQKYAKQIYVNFCEFFEYFFGKQYKI